MTWQKFVDTVVARAGYKSDSDCPSLAALRDIDDLELENGATAMFDEQEKYAKALRLIALTGIDLIPKASRQKIIHFVQRDPSIAGYVYFHEPSLTDGESAALYRSFAPSLPSMKRVIDSGKAKRAKA